MRFLVLALVLVAVTAAVLAMSSEPRGQPVTPDVARLIYLLLLLVLVAGGVMTWRQRQDDTGAKGPGVWMSLAIWAGMFALAVLLYRGAWFWNGIATLFGAAAP